MWWDDEDENRFTYLVPTLDYIQILYKYNSELIYALIMKVWLTKNW